MFITILSLVAIPQEVHSSGGPLKAFAPHTETRVQRVFEERSELNLDAHSLLPEGGTLENMPTNNLKLVVSRQFTLNDQYLESASPADLQLYRRFANSAVEIAGSREEKWGLGPFVLTARSPLDGVSVGFQRHGDVIVASYAQDYTGLPDSLLIGLRETMDTKACLADAVQGATKLQIDPGFFASIVAPGGNMPFEFESASELGIRPMRFGHLFVSEVVDDVSGNLMAKVNTASNEAEKDLTHVLLEVDIACAANLLARLREVHGDVVADAGRGVRMNGCVVNCTLNGNGVLVFDNEVGLLRSVQLDLSTRFHVVIESTGPRPGHASQEVLKFSGRTSIRSSASLSK